MIIESLIRLGRPFLGSSGLTPEEIIKHTADVTSLNARNFFQNVCLVEMDVSKEDDSILVEAHPVTVWGDWVVLNSKTPVASKGRRKTQKAKEVFKAQVDRGVGTPFVMPTGGNPRARQGFYPAPVYIVYEQSLAEMTENKQEVFKFLQARAPFTLGWNVSDEELDVLAEELSLTLPKPKKGPNKTMAIIAITDYRTSSYSHSKTSIQGLGCEASLGMSKLYPGERITANLRHLLERLWEAKLKEAEEKGFLENASCSFCDETTRVVSSYAKAWPLFSTTYSFPLPMELKETELVKSIRLCPKCYQSLIFGANLLYKRQQIVDYTITKELFSPTQSAIGKMTARQSSKTENLYGLSYVLPVLDTFLQNPNAAEDFVTANLQGLDSSAKPSSGLSLKQLLGFETVLAEELATEAYRLTVMYYMGNWSRGSIDIVATVEDVVPSVAKAVSQICNRAGQVAQGVGERISHTWNWSFSDRDRTQYVAKHSSLLYNLLLAYGSSYLWQSLDGVLHRRPLDVRSFVRNVSKRLQDQAKKMGDISTHFGLRDEVVFLLSFSKFLEEYQGQIAMKGDVPVMSNWQEWLSDLGKNEPHVWKLDSAAKMGFAAGTVVRSFSRQYYTITKRDFIKHRVMTFGADLKPRDIFSKGLSRLQEYARRLDMGVNASLRAAAAAVSMGYLNIEDKITRDRDTFIAAFWAGYELCPSGFYSTDPREDDSIGKESEAHE